jgi:hypothetical protein
MKSDRLKVLSVRSLLSHKATCGSMFRASTHPAEDLRRAIGAVAAETPRFQSEADLGPVTEEGLEIEAQDRNWIKARPFQNSFVVNIGELLELATNGYLITTTPDTFVSE